MPGCIHKVQVRYWRKRKGYYVGTATRPQVKAIASVAMVAAGFWSRGDTINGNPVDLPHLQNDILIDALFNVIERFSYDDFHDPTGGLPADPDVGDVYIATATANGWTENYIYTWDGASWDQTVPEHGWLVWIEGQDDFYKYTSNGWETFNTVGTHYHSSLVKSGETTPAWQVFDDGGFGVPEQWRLFPDGNEFKTQRWNGSIWVTVRTTKYVPS